MSATHFDYIPIIKPIQILNLSIIVPTEFFLIGLGNETSEVD